MVIQRGQYVSELLSKRWNGKVKIITGIRSCGVDHCKGWQKAAVAV